MYSIFVVIATLTTEYNKSLSVDLNPEPTSHDFEIKRTSALR